ncbi:MAG: hypothetical protein CMJ49_00605 [Planctomycetaceae bacterium]|nr:hypothetical protein [Planctomycetaceae bacterium]
MSVRDKTWQRLLILLVCIVAALGTGYYFVDRHKSKAEAEALAHKEAGRKAFEAGKYHLTMEELNHYLPENSDDVDALYWHAEARRRLIDPNRKHITHAQSLYRRLVTLTPDNMEHKYTLLRLHDLQEWKKESIDLADLILSEVPGDPTALHMKANALYRMRKFDESLEAAEACVASEPLNFQAQLLIMRLIGELNRSVEGFHERIVALNEQFPKDPVAEYLMAMAIAITGVDENGQEIAPDQTNQTAIQWILKAKAHTPPSPEFAMELCNKLTQVGRLQEAQGVLMQAEAEFDDVTIDVTLAERLWQAGRDDDMLRLLADVDPTDRDAYRDLLLYKALTLIRLKQRDEAAPYITSFKRRVKDAVAQAWFSVFENVLAETPQPLSRQVEILKPLVDRTAGEGQRGANPSNAYFRYFLCEAYRAAGELRLALDQLEVAVAQKPSWTNLRITYAALLSDLGRHSDALSQARSARITAPSDIIKRAAYIGEFNALLGFVQPEATLQLVTETVAAIEADQTTSTDGDRLVPIKLMLLSFLDDDERSEATIDAFLASDRRPDASLLLETAAMCRHIDRAEWSAACLDRYNQLYKPSPESVLATALTMIRQKDADGADQLIREYEQDRRPTAGMVLLRTMRMADDGETDQADQYLADHEKRLPTDPALAFARARILLETEDATEAIRSVKTSMDRVSTQGTEERFRWHMTLTRAMMLARDPRFQSFWEQTKRDHADQVEFFVRQFLFNSSASDAGLSVELSAGWLNAALFPPATASSTSIGDNLQIILDRMVRVDDSLVDLAREMKASPSDGRLLTTYVLFHGMRGRHQSVRDNITRLLSPDFEPSPGLLLMLADACRRVGIEDMRAACVQRYEQTQGQTVDFVRAQAMDLLRQGQVEQAVEYTGKAYRDAAEAQSDKTLQYRLLWAQIMDQGNDDRARNELLAIAREFPNDITILRFIVRARSLHADRDFMDDIIERLKENSSEDSLTWRRARARWLLTSDDVDHTAASRADELLSDIVARDPTDAEARLLWSDALRLLGKQQGSITQVQRYLELEPDSIRVRLHLAQQYQHLGDHALAVEQLKSVIPRADELTQELQQEMASLLAVLEDEQAARAILERNLEQLDPARLRLLAHIYGARNETEKTQALLPRLIASGDPDSIGMAAQYYVLNQQLDEAENTIRQLDDLDVEPAIRHLVRSQYVLSIGKTDEARQLLEDAVVAAPDNLVAWQRLIGFHLTAVTDPMPEPAERYETVFQTVTRAAAANPDNEHLKTLISRSDTLLKGLLSNSTNGITVAAITLPGRLETTLDVLDRLAELVEFTQQLTGDVTEAQREQLASRREEFIRAVGQLTDANADYFELQRYTLNLYSQNRKFDLMFATIERLLQTFPKSAIVTSMVARILGATGRHDDALGAAELWRRTLPGSPIEADLFIAGILAAQGRTEDAERQIQPYLDDMMADPVGHEAVASVYVEILLKQHRYTDVASLARPIISSDDPNVAQRWRGQWIAWAGTRLKDGALAAAWLREAEPLIPPDDIAQQTHLATAWLAFGGRAGGAETDIYQHGMALLKPIVDREDATPEAMLSYASALESSKRRAEAAVFYKRVLAVQQNNPVAMNNLAMILIEVDDARDYEAAEKLGLAAIAANPGYGEFHETVGEAQYLQGKYEQAVEHFQTAVDMKPQELSWQIKLAHLYALTHDFQKAHEMKNEIDALEPAKSKDVTPEVLGRFHETIELLRAEADVTTTTP